MIKNVLKEFRIDLYRLDCPGRRYSYVTYEYDRSRVANRTII